MTKFIELTRASGADDLWTDCSKRMAAQLERALKPHKLSNLIKYKLRRKVLIHKLWLLWKLCDGVDVDVKRRVVAAVKQDRSLK